MGKLKNFTVARNEPVSTFWGNGHTVDTDPTKKGWFCKRILGRPAGTEDAWVVGQPGKNGCATIMLVDAGKMLDVAMYDQPPSAVCSSGQLEAGKFVQLPAIPGSGLMVIEAIQQYRNDLGIETPKTLWLTGTSLSLCIKDVLEGKVDVTEVAEIHTGLVDLWDPAKTEGYCMRLDTLAMYSQMYWKEFTGRQIHDVIKELKPRIVMGDNFANDPEHWFDLLQPHSIITTVDRRLRIVGPNRSSECPAAVAVLA